MKHIILFLLLILMVQSPLVNIAAAQPADKNADKNTVLYGQLVKKRHELQTRIYKAIDDYVDFSKKVLEQTKQLKADLGETPVDEAVKMFQDKNVKMSGSLRVAANRWDALLPDETSRKALENKLDKLFNGRELTAIEVNMKKIDNKCKIGDFLTDDDYKEIDMLMAKADAAVNISTADRLDYEQKAVESLSEMLKGEAKNDEK